MSNQLMLAAQEVQSLFLRITEQSRFKMLIYFGLTFLVNLTHTVIQQEHLIQQFQKKLQKNFGWRVREKVAGVNEAGELEQKVYFVNIKVNMDGEYPPKICVFSEFRGKKSELNSENVGELDRMVINTCDCTINCYESPRFPGKKTGYLRQLYVIQDPAVEWKIR